MNLVDHYARLFVVLIFLGLEAANEYFANSQIIGGMIPNIIAFILFLGAIGYFLFTGPLFGKGKKTDN